MEANLLINGQKYQCSIKPDEVLIDTLRRLGFKSLKKGCDTASCGVCNILVEGDLIPACSYLSFRAEGKSIITLEGVEERAREIGEYIIAQGVDQCGFCSPGHMMGLIALFDQLKNPSLEEVKHFLAGNMCRCSGYEGQHRAISNYLEVRK